MTKINLGFKEISSKKQLPDVKGKSCFEYICTDGTVFCSLTDYNVKSKVTLYLVNDKKYGLRFSYVGE